MEPNAVIELENATIGYDGHAVLSGIDLRIAAGSFMAILGANGSGKSTLLKTLLGLQPVLAGRLRVSGPSGGAPVFGYVPQTTAFDPMYLFTGVEVALMGVFGRVRPGFLVPRAERAHVQECLEATDAAAFAGRRFAELSGGQKQRVLIARALATRPDLLVLDEPTTGVDAAATGAVLEVIARLHRERRLTILLVTHDLPLVRAHAQRVLWLHDGRVLEGAAAEMLTRERLAQYFEEEIVGGHPGDAA